MPTTRERLVSVAIGLGVFVAGLAVVYLGYLLVPANATSLAAVGGGLLVLVGLTVALGALFLLVLPALLPVR